MNLHSTLNINITFQILIFFFFRVHEIVELTKNAPFPMIKEEQT